VPRSPLRFPLELLHRIAAQPRVYDLIQTAAGVAELNRRLAVRIHEIGRAAWILDVGGGTGHDAELWPESQYVCLDNDPLKLQGFRRKNPTRHLLRGDAARLPIRSQSVDVVLCKNVAHHLPEEVFAAFLGESARVLKATGHFLFIDPLWAPERRRGRVLWALDRGSNPRSEETLRALIERRFQLDQWERFAVHHAYVLAVCRPATAASS
jgi:SAM-dependent methyltransferase